MHLARPPTLLAAHFSIEERETSSIYDVRLEGGGQKHPNFADRHDINFVNRGLGGPKLLNR